MSRGEWGRNQRLTVIERQVGLLDTHLLPRGVVNQARVEADDLQHVGRHVFGDLLHEQRAGVLGHAVRGSQRRGIQLGLVEHVDRLGGDIDEGL
jgi:hypothetical protein